MSGVEVDVHIHWLRLRRKARHCATMSTSCCERSLFASHLLHVCAYNSAETLCIYSTRNGSSALALNICASHCKTARIVRGVVDSAPGLKGASLGAFCTRFALRASLACSVGHLSD